MASEVKICGECGAACPLTAHQCWMCQADVRAEPAVVLAEALPQRPSYAPAEWFFAAASLLVVLVLILVGIGVGMQSPGLLVVYVVLVIPPLVGAVVRVKRREAQLGSVSWAEKFVTLVVSGSIMIGVLGLVAAALGVALFVMCFAAMAGGR